VQPFFSTPVNALILGALCGVVGFRLGWRVPGAFVLPLVQGAFGFVAFATSWRSGGAIAGALAVGAWAVGTTLSSLPAFTREESAVDSRVLRAEGYRATMLRWLRTGEIAEGGALSIARAHLRELAAYVAAALLSGNLLSIVMGAVLLNYMNAWVAHLLLRARRPARVALLAWNSWSVVRVAAYVMLGSAMAGPLAAWAGYAADTGELRRLAIAGGVGVILDLALKLALARPSARWLASAVKVD
jgi:hypothetical protein